MSKYPLNLKLEIVKYCLEENHSINEAQRDYHISSRSLVKVWVKKYQMFGIDGLKQTKGSYDGFFKKNVVEYMRANNLSYTETAIIFNLGNHNMPRIWESIYLEKGPQEFLKENRGRKKKNTMKRAQKENKKGNTSKEKELLEEIKQLRMENDYLKKLNALVQERMKRENTKK